MIGSVRGRPGDAGVDRVHVQRGERERDQQAAGEDDGDARARAARGR